MKTARTGDGPVAAFARAKGSAADGERRQALGLAREALELVVAGAAAGVGTDDLEAHGFWE